jgi:formate dehydrogenase iron-sulfur subunit
MTPAMLIDLTRCTGCEACVWACKEANGLPREDGVATLSATTWSALERHRVGRAGETAIVAVRRQCMHCLEPACASVCPVAALHKTPEGPVVYDPDRCIGCRYCMVGCPFGVPKYEWSSAQPKVAKCQLCFTTRLSQGKPPACAAACPTGATRFGDRDQLLQEAARRMAAEPDRYVPRLYGEHEAGGTSILYLSSVPFEQLGFHTELADTPYPGFSWEILSKLPKVVTVGGALLAGIWWITGRRDTLDQARRGEITLEEAMKRRPPLVPLAPAGQSL